MLFHLRPGLWQADVVRYILALYSNFLFPYKETSYICIKSRMEERFRVEFLPEAASFLEEIDEKARGKILFNIRKAQVINDQELFKKLTENIWEFRTLYNKTYYRLFAFWDKSGKKDTVVISTHGLIKKTAKTPKSDLERAERIREEFLSQNKKQHGK